MTSSAKELQDIVGKFEAAPITVVGDLILDHYVWGDVSRISPEAPVVVVNVNKEDRGLGGAGNVVSNLVSLGANVSVSGAVGDDDDGTLVLAMFEELGVDCGGVIKISDRPTTMKTRVMARGQQVVRVDREICDPLAEDDQAKMCERLSASMKDAAGVVVSDYAKGIVTPAVYNCFEREFSEGGLGDKEVPLVIDPKDANFGLYSCATVVKPNRLEAAAASGMQIRDRAEAIAAGRKLASRWNAELILITLGEQGMVLVPKDDTVPATEIDTEAKEVFDVSGAGDTVAAVFTLALAVGASYEAAAKLANIAAGIVVAEIGAVAIEVEQLKEAIA